MRILVTGAAGRLGKQLTTILDGKHTIKGIDIDDVDLVDFAAIRSYALDFNPDVIIHCAAWTDVDGCAQEPEKALRINGYGAQNVALAAAAADAAILHVSTNEVFSGNARRPYNEYDIRGPVNAYAHSKMIGERGVAAVNPRHYIVRTAWLFAHGGKNFLHAILNAAELGKELKVVTDEVANPTYNNDLADAIAKLIETERYGTYHLTNEGAVSRYNFARYVLDCGGFAHVPVTAISSREWPRASTPPTYTALENTAGAMVGITLRPWREAVDAFLAEEGRSITE